MVAERAAAKWHAPSSAALSAAAAAQLGRAATILGSSQNIPPVIQPNLATETIRV